MAGFVTKVKHHIWFKWLQYVRVGQLYFQAPAMVHWDVCGVWFCFFKTMYLEFWFIVS